MDQQYVALPAEVLQALVQLISAEIVYGKADQIMTAVKQTAQPIAPEVMAKIQAEAEEKEDSDDD